MNIEEQCYVSDRALQMIKSIIAEICLAPNNQCYATKQGGDAALAMVVLTTRNVVVDSMTEPVRYDRDLGRVAIAWNAKMFEEVKTLQDYQWLAKAARLKLEMDLEDFTHNFKFMKEINLREMVHSHSNVYEWAQEMLTTGKIQDMASMSDYSKIMYGCLVAKMYLNLPDPKPRGRLLDFFKELIGQLDLISMMFVFRHLGTQAVLTEKLLDVDYIDNVLADILNIMKVSFDEPNPQPA